MSDSYVAARKTGTQFNNRSFAELMAAVLASGRHFRFQASGQSMYPLIHNGDILTVSPLANKVYLGEVIVCLKPTEKTLVVHRIIHIQENKYLIRGDYTPSPDGLVTGNCLIGRVTRIEHAGRSSHWGLGLERILLAFLSRRGWLEPLIDLYQRIRSSERTAHG